jgi:hypothetical protein
MNTADVGAGRRDALDIVAAFQRIRTIFGAFALFSCVIASASAAWIADSRADVSEAIRESQLIVVDQFGYRPGDPKVAVLIDPVAGFNAPLAYEPGPAIELWEWQTGELLLSGEPIAWNGGEMQESSGDRGWWFDFSEVRTPGTYVVVDPLNNLRSGPFQIDENVYDKVLGTALRAFFYNRSGFPKLPPFADPRWQDESAYLGPGQDSQARLAYTPQASGTELDLRGGWFDAGDTNKYATFAATPVHVLLEAFRSRPEIWSDNVGIPESGNGIPDILDEVLWEIDWLERMQQPDGSVILKVGKLGHKGFSPPSSDPEPRFHIGVCSSSTISTASVFAHAALVFQDVPQLRERSRDLLRRAVLAWDWYAANPKNPDCDTQLVKAGDADVDLEGQAAWGVVAAVYLFALTGEERFHRYFLEHFRDTWPFQDPAWSRYHSPQGDALLFYAGLGKADRAPQEEILARKLLGASDGAIGTGQRPDQDLYRSFLDEDAYHWGSNMVRAEQGAANYALAQLTAKEGVGDPDSYLEGGLSTLNYLHGVNPMGLVFLSAMYDLGAERSVNEISHTWFDDGTDFDNSLTSKYGPAPGFMTGGPNRLYSGNQSPPAGQPPQKSYRDWNTGWPENSWEVSEPSMAYQAAYVRLISKFAAADH